MDRFVTVIKPSAVRRRQENGKEQQEQKQDVKYNPYQTNRRNIKQKSTAVSQKRKIEALVAPLHKDGAKPSSSALTKHLLKTLSDERNPIVHSDIYSRTDHVTSTATGHQRGEGRCNQTAYWENRGKKLEDQLPVPSAGPEANILKNVAIYIDGYLDDTTDIEMRRVVTLAGGRILHTPSGATHILTSQQLSGSKTHKVLTMKSRIKVHVVKPGWVFDSIDAGKRLSEREYAVIKSEGTMHLPDMFESRARASHN
ncbi:hypothetical protein CERSUDRAFT_103204 [Gelatoporia subvermispora B]|uniref:BRCT domain-containing protein n=1 Tax=Ceriporiopsis subvermispora (strain B) TaxID=914234 RepID=M2RPL4_CERS8|nr:hypothetical protein CERSUDRAFT_103204 [Gelatoporia subvermispora B]